MTAAARRNSGSIPPRGLDQILSSALAFSRDIKIAHSVFALPFAASALVLGSYPMPSLSQAFLLVICMVTARSYAMGLNRLLDHRIDAKNARTAGRMIPSGKLTPAQSATWTGISALGFVIAAFGLGAGTGFLSFPTLLILGFYSLMKHLSWVTHWYLGFCLGIAPVAVSVALSGSVDLPVILVGLAVMFWVGGFDVIYALQDWRFDRRERLNSLPVTLGPWKALLVSRASFVAMVALLAIAGLSAGMGALYYSGLVIIAGILAAEHWMVRGARHAEEFGSQEKIEGIGPAFMNGNAAVSIIFLVAVVADSLL